MSDLREILSELRIALSYSGTGLSRALETLTTAKIALLSLRSMPPSSQCDPTEIALIRIPYLGETYELGALLSLKATDGPAFEKHISMLKTLYFDYTAVLPESPEQWRLLGLYLTHLLSENKITEFHTELEQIPVSARNNRYLEFAISLEQYFMEGNYNKVQEIKLHAPDIDFEICIDKLINAIRKEVARNMEQAYASIRLSSATQLLMLPSLQELARFIEKLKTEDKEMDWRVEGDLIVFVRAETKKSEELPKLKIMKKALKIATELERIV